MRVAPRARQSIYQVADSDRERALARPAREIALGALSSPTSCYFVDKLLTLATTATSARLLAGACCTRSSACEDRPRRATNSLRDVACDPVADRRVAGRGRGLASAEQSRSIQISRAETLVWWASAYSRFPRRAIPLEETSAPRTPRSGIVNRGIQQVAGRLIWISSMRQSPALGGLDDRGGGTTARAGVRRARWRGAGGRPGAPRH